ncbi:MAG: 3-dehydroquinate synthase, partial [Microthrixaceae bacterium]
AYELDTAMPAGADTGRLVQLMGRDKKALDGLTFALDGAGGVEVIAGVDPALAASVLEEM